MRAILLLAATTAMLNQPALAAPPTEADLKSHAIRLILHTAGGPWYDEERKCEADLTRYDRDHALTQLMVAEIENCTAEIARQDGKLPLVCHHYQRGLTLAAKASAMTGADKFSQRIANSRQTFENSLKENFCDIRPAFEADAKIRPAPLKQRAEQLTAAVEKVRDLTESGIDAFDSASALNILYGYQGTLFALMDDLLASGLSADDAGKMLEGLVQSNERLEETLTFVRQRIHPKLLSVYQREMLKHFASYRRTQVTEAVLMAGPIRSALRELWSDTGKLPADAVVVLLADFQHPKWRMAGVREVKYAKGTITFHFGPEVAPDATLSLQFQPAGKEGRSMFDWSCTASASLRPIAPESCK